MSPIVRDCVASQLLEEFDPEKFEKEKDAVRNQLRGREETNLFEAVMTSLRVAPAVTGAGAPLAPL